jgi:hypothetical protein
MLQFVSSLVLRNVCILFHKILSNAATAAVTKLSNSVFQYRVIPILFLPRVCVSHLVCYPFLCPDSVLGFDVRYCP